MPLLQGSTQLESKSPQVRSSPFKSAQVPTTFENDPEILRYNWGIASGLGRLHIANSLPGLQQQPEQYPYNNHSQVKRVQNQSRRTIDRSSKKFRGQVQTNPAQLSTFPIPKLPLQLKGKYNLRLRL
ncbi:MAG: hypothetical protein K0R59_3743 [Sphingobacterium sp.]|jgi:hypothetical protein|nr:hypothetical protein [Sphingobacterium sp.]